MAQQTQVRCPDCQGEGEIIKEKDRCGICKGKKVVNETKTLEVHIDKGMKDNQKIFFRGEGDQQPEVEPGDVIIVLQQKEHEKFERTEDDLYMKHQISLTEALCGFSFVVKHLDGRDMVFTQPAGQVIKPNEVKTVTNEGMPIHKNPFERGNLYVTFDVKFPLNHFTSEHNLKALEALLPPRQSFSLPQGEHVEEVDMEDYIPGDKTFKSERNEAYASDDDDMQGHGIQCAHQ